MKNLLLIALAVLASACCKQGVEETAKVDNVIFVIGDGMGLAHVCTLDSASNFERAQNIAFSKTYSADHRVTDSAAGGTALACGVKTKNGMLGLDADSNAVYSLLHVLKTEKDYNTGIVVSCELFHATPASFYAHCPNRKLSEDITKDLYVSGVDILMGGAGNIVSPDSLAAKGYSCCASLDQVAKIDSGKVAALLAANYLPPAGVERGDTLVTAVKEALRLLSASDKNFALMIESSQIDWSCHNNDSSYLRNEIVDTNKIVGICFDYADKHPGTLVVVTADHETGGVTLVGEEKKITFSSGDHTGIYVPIYLYGTGADQINGIVENCSLKERILSLIK